MKSTDLIIKIFVTIVLTLGIERSIFAAEMKCTVIDPQLQDSYKGNCDSAGFADGEAVAKGLAEYSGYFQAGKKHGKGTKIWPSGDRYTGQFFEDQMQGYGVYTWGKETPWAGQRYMGSYKANKRNGQGAYEWSDGRYYAGAWLDDQPLSEMTPMQILQAQHRQAVHEAVSKIGTKVCREETIGINNKEQIEGQVTAIDGNRINVNILTTGEGRRMLNGIDITPGMLVWDEVYNWLPCY